MNRNPLETALGAVVLAVTVIFLVFAYSSAKVTSVDGYAVTARFDHIADIRAGGDVELSGIRIGSITSLKLDPKTYQAIVVLSIDKSVQLPDDSQAVITSSGLLGDKYLALIPGGSDKMIQPGGIIRFTQSPASLEDLLGKVVFGLSQSKSGQNSGGQTSSAPAASAPAPSAPAGPAVPAPAKP